jgi:YesN/AraC family two-component response regulator
MSSDIEVLIADDHELIRNGLRQVIESQTKYQVYVAEDGKEALDK